jgi:hypothetical protein
MLLVIFVATKSGTGLAKDGFCFVKNPARTVSLQQRRIQHPKVLFEKLTLIENMTHIQVFKNKLSSRRL